MTVTQLIIMSPAAIICVLMLIASVRHTIFPKNTTYWVQNRNGDWIPDHHPRFAQKPAPYKTPRRRL